MLTIQSITASYGQRPVLSDFSLNVAHGEVAAIIGPNGCGKSTMLRCVAGLMPVEQGTVRLDDEAVAGMDVRTRARRIALLPQTFEGGYDMTVEEMTLLGRTPHLPPYGAPGAHDWEVVDAALHAASLQELRTRRVGEVSGGERQRVILARALAQQPRVLLLDEPTSNLDIRYQHEILSLVRRLARRERLAVIVVLHQINLAAAVADHMVLLASDGRTRAAGAAEHVMTLEHLQAVYETPLRVVTHPLSGRPQAQAMWRFDD